MKRREQALLLLRNAGQDEALLDEVIDSRNVDDEVVGFHCHQAAEKIIKALLSDLSVRSGKTRNIRSLKNLLAEHGYPLPAEFASLEAFTPFAVAFRYEDYEPELPLDRELARAQLRALRNWVEAKLQERSRGE